MNRTSIEWTNYTSNLIRYRDPEGRSVHGCIKVSAGCANWSVNLRSLFNFLSLRNAPQAQREIRVLAQQVEDIVSAHMPETMSTWRTAGGTAV